jgi:hypothetical protein
MTCSFFFGEFPFESIASHEIFQNLCKYGYFIQFMPKKKNRLNFFRPDPKNFGPI